MKLHPIDHPCPSVRPGLKLGASCGLSIDNTVLILRICLMEFMQDVRYPCRLLKPSTLRDRPGDLGCSPADPPLSCLDRTLARPARH